MSGAGEKVVLDLETQKGFDEVQGRNLTLLGISVAAIYSYQEDRYRVFKEGEIKQLLPYLQRAQLVIGFNIKGFDYPVLQPYLDFDLKQLNTLDILEEVSKSLGFRISLNSIAKATLEIGKIGSGLDALKYFRQGEMEKLCEYCRHDVLVTRKVYEYGRQYGHLLYFRGLGLETIPIGWAEYPGVETILREAFGRRSSVEIEYSTPANNAGRRHKRKVDIYAFDFGRIIAYCHLRKEMRTFNIRRILSVKPLEDNYEIPADFKLQDFKAKQKLFKV
jgi:hypothetical protein